MTATNRGGSRDPDDFYRTPRSCIDLVLDRLERRGLIGSGFSILDPGAGDGAITEAILDRYAEGSTVVGVELDAGRAARAAAMVGARGRVVHDNFLSWAPRQKERSYDVVVGNPPFSSALEFVKASMRLSPIVAMLLRLPWLASQERADFLRANTPTVWVLPKRPSFVMVVRCSKFKKRRRGDGRQDSIRFEGECSYEEYFEVGSKRPSACPTCGNKVVVTTSDSTDYGWFCWGLGVATVEILPTYGDGEEEQ